MVSDLFTDFRGSDLVLSKFSSRIYRNMRERLSQLNTKLNESISGMRIIQQFRQEKRLAKEFEEVNEEYLATRYAMIKTNSILLSQSSVFICFSNCLDFDVIRDSMHYIHQLKSV